MQGNEKIHISSHYDRDVMFVVARNSHDESIYTIKIGNSINQSFWFLFSVEAVVDQLLSHLWQEEAWNIQIKENHCA